MPTQNNIYYFSFVPTNPRSIPVVLLHGVGGTHLSWPPELRRLGRYRTFSIDLPGHGKSGSHGEQDITTYAQRVSEWMHSIKLPRAVIIGHSMGGGIALEIAHKYPNRVIGLGLISTGARLTVNPGLLENSANPSAYPTVVDNIISWSFSQNASPRIVEIIRKRFLEERQSVLSGDLQACNQFDITTHLPAISIPTIVICGENDRMTPHRLSQLLTSKMQKASLSIIPEAGHMVILENPSAVRGALISFLDSI